MAANPDLLNQLTTDEAPMPDLDLSWLGAGDPRPPVRARPGQRGLTLDEISVGGYGIDEAPAPDDTERPRGVAARDGVPRVGYHIREASSVWSRNASLLYEEAIQRQWSSATDIPWAELRSLPDR